MGILGYLRIRSLKILLNEVKEMRQKLNFKYLIVDEYQDISRQRFDLVKAFFEVTDAKVVAVGDDWQSIYAFSGSDITLFTKFQEKMGYAKLMKIVRTYRNSQEVIDIAGNFIQKNASQIQKSLISPKHIEEPVIIYTYDSTAKDSKVNRRSGVNYAIAYAVQTMTGMVRDVIRLFRIGIIIRSWDMIWQSWIRRPIIQMKRKKKIVHLKNTVLRTIKIMNLI